MVAQQLDYQGKFIAYAVYYVQVYRDSSIDWDTAVALESTVLAALWGRS